MRTQRILRTSLLLSRMASENFPNKIDFEINKDNWKILQTRVLIDFPRKVQEIDTRIDRLEKQIEETKWSKVTELAWWLGLFGTFAYVTTRK